MSQVVVTLKAPPLGALGANVAPARRRAYAHRLDAAQAKAERTVLAAIPEATIRWRYRLVANGFAVVVPAAKAHLLEHLPGIAKTWPDAVYASAAVRVAHGATINQGPEVIGADKLWGPRVRDGRQRDQDRDHRRRRRRDAPLLRHDRPRLPAGLPEGAEAVHDDEGDRAAHVLAAVARRGGSPTRRSTRPSRSTRPTSAGSRPATTGRRPATSSSRASPRTRISATTRR